MNIKNKGKIGSGLEIRETWDFSSMYSGIKDPKIERDLCEAEKAYAIFAKKYSGQSAYMTNASKLKSTMEDWKKLLSVTGTIKPLWYLQLMMEIDSSNDAAKAIFNSGMERITKAANAVVFFNLNLGKITPTNQKKFLTNPKLAEYRTYLFSIFEVAKHNLSEKEEKILNLKYMPAHEMWVSAQQKLLTSQMVKHKSKLIPITEAQAIKADLPIKERRALHIEITKKFREVSFFAEAELNAVVTDKRISNELRGFEKPYESTVLGYQNSLESVENLVSVVTRRMPDAHRFWKLKAKVLGLPKLTLAEMGTSMSKSKKKYSLEDGVRMVYEALESANPKFAKMFADFAATGHIDFRPRKGKRGGAFCSGGIGVPTQIMLNHVDDMNSIFTMAHEMGHAIHTELSAKQGVLYADYTISIAEVASTFFENIMFDYLYERSDEREKVAMLLEKTQDNIFTVHSQIGYFNFEVKMHEEMKKKGMLSAAELAKMFLDCRKSYLGNAFEYSENDGYSYVAIPHFRYFFYVYSYAYGQLIANALYAEYKKNPAFLEKVEYFLSAGGSKKPDDIFKDIGIDVTKPDFFEKGLEEILGKIKEAERLVGKGVR